MMAEEDEASLYAAAFVSCPTRWRPVAAGAMEDKAAGACPGYRLALRYGAHGMFLRSPYRQGAPQT